MVVTARLTPTPAARNIASGAVESSILRREPPRNRGYFHALILGVPPYGGAPSVGNASGLSSAAFQRSRRQVAVESLLRGDRNATEEASMATSGYDEPRCALAERHAP